MKVARIVSTALLCLGLGVPSAHGIALCVDVHGNLSVEAAVDGACAGTRAGAGSRPAPSQRAPGFQARAADYCGGCRDVIISGSDIGAPAHVGAKTHRTSPVEGGASPFLAETTCFEDGFRGRPGNRAASGAAHGPPTIRTVVLRL